MFAIEEENQRRCWKDSRIGSKNWRFGTTIEESKIHQQQTQQKVQEVAEITSLDCSELVFLLLLLLLLSIKNYLTNIIIFSIFLFNGCSDWVDFKNGLKALSIKPTFCAESNDVKIIELVPFVGE